MVNKFLSLTEVRNALVENLAAIEAEKAAGWTPEKIKDYRLAKSV